MNKRQLFLATITTLCSCFAHERDNTPHDNLPLGASAFTEQQRQERVSKDERIRLWVRETREQASQNVRLQEDPLLTSPSQQEYNVSKQNCCLHLLRSCYYWLCG